MKRPRAAAAEPADSRTEFRLDDFLPYQLSVTSNRVARMFARNLGDEFGLTIPEWRVIVVVGRFEAISPSRVSDRTGMDKVKVSRAAATLVARGLLRQSQDPADGRARVLRMTRKGERVYAGAVPLARQLEGELKGALSRVEWATLQKALMRLHGHLEEDAGLDSPTTLE
jgi:DNA-binding MarR family transcriptional regulator